MTRWGILLALLLLMLSVALASMLLRQPSKRHEPPITNDSVISDPRCIEMLKRVARREPSVLEAARNGREPIGMRCSNFDIRDAMKSESAIVESQIENSLTFKIRSKDRWLFSKPSRFGSYQFDTIKVNKDAAGRIRFLSVLSLYVT